MTPERRRALIDALKGIPPEHRAWIAMEPSVRGFELFAYYGWGVVLNDAQLEAAQDVLEWPAGSVHIWRFGNRVGKTTGLLMLEEYLIWKKWRYQNADLDGWIIYRYKVLHAAPLGRLMGKAWEIADALIDGSSLVQRNPLTLRQRPGIFVKSPMFRAGTGKGKDGQDSMFVQCLNGGVVDFLQTESGAGRMESDAWWFIAWDEFGEHQPVSSVPYLFDSTFLPRSSDHMAPIVLSSTEKDHSAAVYMELEDIAERSPHDFNLKQFGREVNFSQSRESMDRQVRLSTDTATAQRSVYGGAAEGSTGSLLPAFVLKRAFDPTLPAHRSLGDLGLPPNGKRWKLIQTFDHAMKGDRNVVLTTAVPWPVLSKEDLIAFPAVVIDCEELRGSRSLTTEEMIAFAVRAYVRHGSLAAWYTDTTGEAGIMVHKLLRAKGVPSREFNFTARKSPTDRRTMKGYGRTGLQRLFSLGLIVDDRTGFFTLPAGMPIEQVTFGGIRIPLPDATEGPVMRRVYRQLAMLRVDDKDLVQDHAMTVLMLAAVLYPYLERPMRRTSNTFSPFGTRDERLRGVASIR